MKKFNLFNEIIIAQKSELINAINTTKEFSVTINGEIRYEPYLSSDIFIFRGKHTPAPVNAMTPPKTFALSDVFGKNYQIVEDGERVLIKAFSNWQELIGLNTPNASYDDTTADGVAEFSNKELEDIGWYATDFNADYRDLVDVLESKCKGIVLCIEQEEPYQFSGLGFIEDNEEAKKVLFEYCQNHVKDKIANDEDFIEEFLEDDEIKAAKFFDVL